MTPQLMQAIKLLQLSNLDLVSYVEAELERNPLLDRNGEIEAPPNGTEKPLNGEQHANGEAWQPSHEETPAPPGEERPRLEGGGSADDSEPIRPRTSDMPAGYSEWAGVGPGGRDDADYNLEAFVSVEKTLSDWLREQLTVAIAEPSRRMIGQYLIDLVDEAGYLSSDIEAAAEKLGTSVAEMEAVLAILQTFDPPGVCARELSECLAIQLRERNRLDPAMAALIGRLDLLARREFPALKKICGVNDEDLAEMVTEIRRLNPKPGLAFGSAPVQPIVPDVFVRPAPDGSWLVELNSDTLPKVLVNQSYYAQVSATTRRDTEKSYLTDCLQSATWLVRALDQRARTILKVSNEIVRQQDAFFANGVEHLRPLNLKTVAEAIGMHEFDGVAGHRQQIHGDHTRHFRTEIFFHVGNRSRPWRRSAFGRSGAAPHQADDRRRERRGGAVRRYHRGQAARGRHRYRAAHGGKIPGSDAHSVIGAAPPREAGIGDALIGTPPSAEFSPAIDCHDPLNHYMKKVRTEGTKSDRAGFRHAHDADVYIVCRRAKRILDRSIREDAVFRRPLTEPAGGPYGPPPLSIIAEPGRRIATDYALGNAKTYRLHSSRLTAASLFSGHAHAAYRSGRAECNSSGAQGQQQEAGFARACGSSGGADGA